MIQVYIDFVDFRPLPACKSESFLLPRATMNDHAIARQDRLGKIRTESMVETKVTMLLRRCRQVWFYNAKKRRKDRGTSQKKNTQKNNRSHPIALGAHLDHLLWCSARKSAISVSGPRKKKGGGGGETYFLFLFEPPGSSTSIPSSSFRPALAAARLLAFCFSRRRSATSLSTTFRASSC
jgi:hypothetical protein